MIVVYLSDISDTPIAQVFDVYGFSCRKKLSDYDEATFTLKNDNPIASRENLKEYNRVVITLEKEDATNEFIDGYIKSIKIGVEETAVLVRSREHLLSKKLVHAARVFTTDTIKEILEDLLTEINTRSDTGLTIHEDTSLDVLPLDINKNTSLLSVLKTIAGKGYSFKVIDRKILVGLEIGQDRTIPNVVEYYNTGYYTFDGVDDYLATTTKHAYTLSTSKNIVIAGRFKLWADAVDTFDSQTIISLPYCYVQVRTATNQLVIRYDNAGARVALTTLWSGDRERHYFVAAVYNNGTNWTTDLYLDGFLANTANHAVAPSQFITDEIRIGRRWTAAAYFNGSIKHPAIYTFTGTTFYATDAALIRAGSTPTYTLGIAKYTDRTFNDVHTRIDTNNLDTWNAIDVVSDSQLNLVLTTGSDYTHLIDVANDADKVVNGVTMNRTVGEWSYSVTGSPSTMTNNLGGGTTIGAERSKLEEDFQYWINSRTITMSGLTIGEKYTFVRFNGDRDANTGDFIKFTMKGITSNTYLRNVHRIITFDYIADSTSMLVTFEKDGGAGSPHFYAFANGLDLRGLKIYGAPVFVEENGAPFADSLFIDNNYFELKRKRDEPGDTNVRDVSIAYDADTISNAITEKTTGFTTDTDSILEYGRLEENITADGGITESINNALDSKKASTAQVDIDPIVDDFFFTAVGDKLQAEIDLGNNITYYSGAVYVTEITVRGEGLGDIKAKVSNGNIYTRNLLETIKEYNERINRLELQ